MDTAWLFQALFHLAAEQYPRVSSQDLFCSIIASIHQQHWNTLRMHWSQFQGAGLLHPLSLYLMFID
jgi:hypothetical protein